MKGNFTTYFLGFWITFWGVFTVLSVGETYSGGILTWDLPFVILIFMAVPAWLGYLVGKNRK